MGSPGRADAPRGHGTEERAVSEILGYDVNGRPLRAGDRVVPHDGGRSGWMGCEAPPPWTISHWHEGHQGLVMREPGLDGEEFGAFPEFVRHLDDRTDHQPADAEFAQWLRGVTSGVPA